VQKRLQVIEDNPRKSCRAYDIFLVESKNARLGQAPAG
jgi:hypothetical protein